MQSPTMRRALSMPLAPRLLIALLAVDVALIALHVWAGLSYERIPALLNIAADGSVAEIVGYAKWLAAAVLLVAAWRKGGGGLLLAGATAFAIVLADDALRLHEQGGGWLAGRVGPDRIAGMRPQDLGELGAFAAMGLVALALTAWAWANRRPGDAQRARWLLALFVLLALIGVALDLLHATVDWPYPIPQLLDILEDGGELMLGSVAVAHAAALLRRLS